MSLSVLLCISAFATDTIATGRGTSVFSAFCSRVLVQFPPCVPPERDPAQFGCTCVTALCWSHLSMRINVQPGGSGEKFLRFRVPLERATAQERQQMEQETTRTCVKGTSFPCSDVMRRLAASRELTSDYLEQSAEIGRFLRLDDAQGFVSQLLQTPKEAVSALKERRKIPLAKSQSKICIEQFLSDHGSQVRCLMGAGLLKLALKHAQAWLEAHPTVQQAQDRVTRALLEFIVAYINDIGENTEEMYKRYASFLTTSGRLTLYNDQLELLIMYAYDRGTSRCRSMLSSISSL